MFELTTLRRTFSETWLILRYSLSDEIIDVSFSAFPECPDFVQEYVSGNIQDLLNKQSRRRPGASDICRVFSVYSGFLKLFDSQDLSTVMIIVHNPPSYKEWKELVRKQTDDYELLCSLAKQYEKDQN